MEFTIGIRGFLMAGLATEPTRKAFRHSFSPYQLFQNIFDFLRLKGKSTTEEMRVDLKLGGRDEKGFAAMPRSFYTFLFEEKAKSYDDFEEMIEYYEPQIWVQEYGENWFIIKAVKKGEADWLFFFREKKESSYSLVKAPDKISVGKEGVISLKCGDRDFTFQAFEHPWPWPLLEPERFVTFVKLNLLLKTADENPLTILLRSPNPYKGLASQLLKALVEIRDEWK